MGYWKVFMAGRACRGCEAGALWTLWWLPGHLTVPLQGAGGHSSGSPRESHTPVFTPRSLLWALLGVALLLPEPSPPAACFSACNLSILPTHAPASSPGSLQKKARFMSSVSFQQISQVTPLSKDPSPNNMSDDIKKETLQVNKSLKYA